MASNDPGISELDDPVPVEEARGTLSRVCILEDTVKILFEYSKKVIAEVSAIGNVTNLELCHLLIFFSNESRLTYSNYSDLRKAYHSMFSSAFAVAGPDVQDINLQPSNSAQSSVEKAFLAVVSLMRRQEAYREEGSEPTIKNDFDKELENRMFELYLSVQGTVGRVVCYEVAMAGKEVQDVIEYAINYSPQNPALERSSIALTILIGFIAAEMERAVITARDASLVDIDEPCLPNPFCFDLYLFMGYRYRIISKEDYQRLRSQTVANHFTSKIGKAVILLGHAYRPKIAENLIGVMPYFKMNLRTCNSLYYVTRFVGDSIKAYPSSSYRYMVLLCLISEITLALYHDKENADPLRDYVNEACRYYNESGMISYETRLRSHDEFRDLTNQAKHLDKAWKTVSLVAVDATVLRSHTTRDLMARYDGRVEGCSFELVSSTRTQGDKDSEKDALEGMLLDDEDILNPENDGMSDYLDSGRKSPLPKAELEPANVEGKSNLEDQKGATSTKERKGSADVEGKSNSESQKGATPTKKRKGSADVEGNSNSESQKCATPTKKRKGSADVEGNSNSESQKGATSKKERKGSADVEGNSNSESQKGATSAKERRGSEDVEGKSNSESQKGATSTKERKGSADVEGKSNSESQKGATSNKERKGTPTKKRKGSAGKFNPRGQENQSPTKRRKQLLYLKAGESCAGIDSRASNIAWTYMPKNPVLSREEMLVINLPVVPTGQMEESSTQSSLHPSGEGNSSSGVQPNSAEDEGESNTPEDVPPRQGSSRLLHPSGEGNSSPGVQPNSAEDEGESNTPEDVPPRQGASRLRRVKKPKKFNDRR